MRFWGSSKVVQICPARGAGAGTVIGDTNALIRRDTGHPFGKATDAVGLPEHIARSQPPATACATRDSESVIRISRLSVLFTGAQERWFDSTRVNGHCAPWQTGST